MVPLAVLSKATTWIRLGCLGIACLGAVLAGLVLRPHVILVERVTFEGSQRATAAELRHLADLPNGTSILSVDVEAVARGVQRHPWVRHAEAEVKWPHTVQVVVDEFRPVALLHAGASSSGGAGGLRYVDASGVAFLPGLPGDRDYPHLTGLGAELGQVHPELPALALRDALWLLDTLDARGLVHTEQISEIAFSRSRGWTVHAGGSRITFGHSQLAGQADRLAALLDQGLDLADAHFVDLAPRSVAIVRPLAHATGTATVELDPSPGATHRSPPPAATASPQTGG